MTSSEKRQILTKPIVTESAGSIKIDWCEADEMVFSASIERLSENSRGITGEFNFSHLFDEFPPIKHLYLNLRSPKARQDIVKRLEALSLPVDFNYLSLVDQVCDLAIDSLRKETPLENINLPAAEQAPLEYLLYPILIKNEPTTIYGAGGFGKSILADLIAAMVQFNMVGLGWLVHTGNVLYLDWETNANTHKNYIRAIKAGLGIDDNAEILYRFCERDMIDDIGAIQKIVAEKKIDLVIIDSQMAATANPRPGLDASQVASAYYNALRTLHTTTLTIDHITKMGMSEFGDSDTAYGSVVKYNRARKQFLVKKTQVPGDDFIEMALVNKKFNLGKLHKPIGIRINFTNDDNGNPERIDFLDCAIVDNPELARTMPMWERIANELKTGPHTLAEIADTLDTTQASAKTILYKYKTAFVKVDDKWGLKSNRNDW